MILYVYIDVYKVLTVGPNAASPVSYPWNVLSPSILQKRISKHGLLHGVLAFSENQIINTHT